MKFIDLDLPSVDSFGFVSLSAQPSGKDIWDVSDITAWSFES